MTLDEFIKVAIEREKSISHPKGYFYFQKEGDQYISYFISDRFHYQLLAEESMKGLIEEVKYIMIHGKRNEEKSSERY